MTSFALISSLEPKFVVDAASGAAQELPRLYPAIWGTEGVPITQTSQGSAPRPLGSDYKDFRPVVGQAYRDFFPQPSTHGGATAPLAPCEADANPTSALDQQAQPAWAPSVVPLRTTPVRPVRSQAIAEWHGQVLEVFESCFVAELRGVLGEGVAASHEEATIPKDLVRAGDESLLMPGAFFSYCVNWEIENNTRRKYTDLVFRRMPSYRREELEEASRTARDLLDGIRVE